MSDIELSEKEQEELLSSYDQERRISSKSNSPTEGKLDIIVISIIILVLHVKN